MSPRDMDIKEAVTRLKEQILHDRQCNINMRKSYMVDSDIYYDIVEGLAKEIDFTHRRDPIYTNGKESSSVCLLSVFYNYKVTLRGDTDIPEKVYLVYTTRNERGEPGEMLGVTKDESVARDLAKGRGWYGSEGIVKAATIVNSLEEFEEERERERVERYKKRFSAEDIAFIKENF